MENEQLRASHGQRKPSIVVMYSFGFKYGVPIDANLVLDVRFLPNPYWEENLRSFSGLDPSVADYVLSSETGQKFLSLIKPLLSFVVDNGHRGQCRIVRIAVGCTGGRHRSVAVVEALRQFFADQEVHLTVFHRDREQDY